MNDGPTLFYWVLTLIHVLLYIECMNEKEKTKPAGGRPPKPAGEKFQQLPHTVQPPDLVRDVRMFARRRGVRVSQVIRDAIIAYLAAGA